jgi:hypothetical protein
MTIVVVGCGFYEYISLEAVTWSSYIKLRSKWDEICDLYIKTILLICYKSKFFVCEVKRVSLSSETSGQS